MSKDLRSSNVLDLEATASASATDLVPAERNGRDVYLTAQQIADLGGGGGAVSSVDGRTGAVTLTDLYDANGAAATAQSNAIAASQPLDADLTAIAASTTTSYGRAFLTLANAAAGISALALDADLATFALPASTTISAFGATLVDDADAATARTTIGLSNVDNTSDANKPVSTATQTALNLKANLASPALTGTPTAPTATAQDNSTKLATTAYVDSAIAGLSDKPAVAYASTSALPANTYANGSSGVGATLTGNANGPLLIDGVTLVIGQAGERVLVAGESTQANNGWYVITQVGVVAVSPYILTRATESDQAAEIGAGYLTAVTAPNTVTPGTSNNGKAFISIAADPFTVGTTALTFSQVGSTYSAGTGLGLSGTTFSIDTTVTVDKTTAQTLTTKTLTSPVLNTGVSGTAIDTDSTMAANSDTILATQKAIKTALALKANLASPILTGTPAIAAATGTSLTTTGDLTTSAGKLVVGAPSYSGTAIKAVGTMSIEDTGGLGLLFVGTGFGVQPALDLRRVNGSFAVPSAVDQDDVLFSLNVGACTTDTTTPPVLDDVAQQWCVATEAYTPTANGNEWRWYTTPNGSSTKTLAATIGQDQSLTVVGTINQTVDSTTALVGGIFRARRSRSSGAINSADVLGTVIFQGHDGTAYGTGVTLATQATQTWTTSAHGTKLIVNVVANGSITAGQAVVIDQDSSVTILQPTLGTNVQVLTTTATNDDPTEQVFQDRVTTTNATPTNFGNQISLPASTTVMVEAYIVARRTGGSAGAADDVGTYIIRGAFKSSAQVGATNKLAFESQAGWDADFGAVASNLVPITVTGATNNNVTWHVTYRRWAVGT